MDELKGKIVELIAKEEKRLDSLQPDIEPLHGTLNEGARRARQVANDVRIGLVDVYRQAKFETINELKALLEED